MKLPTEKQAVSTVSDLVTEFLGESGAIRVEHVGDTRRYDYAISAGSHRFAAEYKSSASAGVIAAAIQGLKQLPTSNSDVVTPLVIVPFMGEVGRELCKKSRMSWLDLSGNADITAPGLKIRIEGRPNKYSERGRPPNLFASKSSRIARQLLLFPGRFQTQVELVRQTGLDDGYVSKIVRRLKQEQYVVTDETGAIRPRDPDVLLDAWRNAYEFTRHRIVKGHVTARSGEELLERVVRAISRASMEWATTGLSAAWLYTHFAAFRVTTIYISTLPTRSLFDELDFTDEPRGANLWLVLPDDEGVFHGSRVCDGVRCVSAVQTYVDLKDHPERANEAAAALRGQLLQWD